MTTTTPQDQVTTVQKSVTVKADLEHAFNVFTAGFDTWWPRSHHIGKKPLQKAVIEPRAGGRCFGREADGTECQWGTVTTWEPPQPARHRLAHRSELAVRPSICRKRARSRCGSPPSPAG